MEQERRIQIREEKRQKSKKRRKAFFKLFAFFLFIIVAAVLSLTVFFKAEKIQLDGTSVYSEEEIISAAGIGKKENLFLLNKQKIKRNIEEKYPDIGSIEISVKLPDRVIIKDTGYSSLFALKSDNKYIIIDKEKNIRRIANARPSRIVLIEKVGFEAPKLYSKINFKNDKQFDGVLTLMSAFKENGLSRISSISVESLDTIQAVYDSRITMIIGNLTNLSEKLQKAKYIIDIEENKNSEGTLDLTVDNTAYFK